MTKEEKSTLLIDSIVEGMSNLKAKDITVMDLREIENSFCKYFVICTGNSNIQVNSIADSVERTVKKETNEKPWHIEGTENARWVLMDYADVVVHIFQQEYREYYDIESLWGDAKEIVVNSNY